MCKHVLPVWIPVHQVLIWSSHRSDEGVGNLDTGVMDGPETPCGCLEKNPTSLEEQSLQHLLIKYFLKCVY